MKKALIFGVTGQDGAYLAKYLLSKNYSIFGTSRNFTPAKLKKLKILGIDSKITKTKINLLSQKSIHDTICKIKPDEIYNFAGVSSVLEPFRNPTYTAKINGLSVLYILETIRKNFPHVKFFQASSSEMFASSKSKLNESTSFSPTTPYAISKVFAHEMTIQYRKNFGLYTCCGILFNHESPLRGSEFVTSKIVNSMVKIRDGKLQKFTLGNINSQRDWGFAGDYVECMWKMLQQKKPDDYVIATGISHSVKEFLIKTAELCGISNWKNVVEIDDDLKRRIDYKQKIGDPSKAKKNLKWKPKTNFEDLIKLMIETK